MAQPTPYHQRTQGVVVACRRPDERWLLIRRSATVPGPLRVCFPGGWIEAGESQVAAAMREMREELDADVEPVCCVWRHVYGSPRRTLWVWLAQLKSATVIPNPAEVHEVLWLTTAEVLDHPDVLPHTDTFLAALLGALRGQARGR